MFIALDKLTNQGLKQAIIVVPEKAIGASFDDEPLTQYGFCGRLAGRAEMEPVQRAGCGQRRQGQGGRLAFLQSDAKVLVCTHATFRFAVDEFGVEAFDDRLIAVDEFHHVIGQSRQQARLASRHSSSPATKYASWSP